ncbi:alpha/beta fold hydrolase [Pseudonocardia sp. TRM90224]|uniref:alpha/beta fold hydrolase n=1 Tax=Pseudonocardia sp. TRM90224 TaxID=2812678 RepID=UPI001E5F8E90|nr:alpha/beta hydrolase [Pseudonocardia sp. TRM90224]
MNVTTSTLDVPGARLHHEVRGSGPLLVLVGAPMDADAFAPLAELLAVDHTVLTTDPRGIKRSSVDEPDLDSTPEVRADDLARLISSLDKGPAIVLGSSGGAVTALALAQARPELVRTVIAHEPPLIELLDDREQLRAETEKQASTYLDGDVLGAWRLMLEQANIVLPDEVMEQMFGGERDPQSVADERFWFAHEMRPSTFWQPDLAVLGSTPARLVIGIGEDSTGQLCDRTAQALATALGTDPVRFPGDHTGFVGDPAGFAARLREVLGS